MADDLTLTLAECLDAVERDGLTLDDCLARYPEHRAALAELLPLALTLRAAPAVAPSVDFRAHARQRLIARLQPSAPATGLRSIGQWLAAKPALLRGLAVALLVVLLGASVVYVSADALPYDVLYPVKIAV
jgi:hypothetical protein